MADALKAEGNKLFAAKDFNGAMSVVSRRIMYPQCLEAHTNTVQQ